MKVALVHDYLFKLGGAERVLKVLSEMYPEAPIYTLLYDEAQVGNVFPAGRVIPSYLQKLPKFLRERHTYFLGFLPGAIESFDFSGYDLVISSSNSFAHGIVTNTDTKHICYYHSPMRYAWDWYNEYFEELKFSKLKRGLAKFLLHKIRMWDQLASKRPDVRLANSDNVKNRIEKYYKLDSEVIYPPVDIERFDLPKKKDEEDFFLIVSTLTPYKRIDLAVEFFNRIGKKLVIVGSGKAEGDLRARAGLNIEFRGSRSDSEVAELMSRARGFIFPGEEDFGITPVEAMAAGLPVFALRRGGVTETVIDGETGIFFEEPTLESFEEGFAKFLSWEKKFFDPDKARARAREFSREKFEEKIRSLL